LIHCIGCSVEPVYQPSEDSYLLQRYVERLTRGDILDVGTGSGIQAITAASRLEVKHVVATEINPLAIRTAIKKAKKASVLEKIEFVVTNLFDGVIGSFDWIIFNPPYLQSEEGLVDHTWEGGTFGIEVIERFLVEAPRHLAANGSILFIYSSETGISQEGRGYIWEILEEKELFFETLYCARLSLS
jgi:release factor glutamine methyltransferase